MPRRTTEPAIADLPQFAEVVGVPMPEAELGGVIQQSVEEMANALGCTRLLALSCVPGEETLKGVTTVRMTIPGVRDLRLRQADIPLVDRAVRTGQILVVGAEQLAPSLAVHFAGVVVIVPLRLGQRTLAVLVGQAHEGLEPRSNAWQERARVIAERAALVVELERVASAFRDEMRLRMAGREMAAAMLEGRPIQEIADLILDTVAQRLRVSRLALFLHDADGAPRPLVARGVSEEYGAEISRLVNDNRGASRAFVTELPNHLQNIQNDERVPQEMRALFRRERITALLLAALHHGREVTGVLCVFPEEGREFTPAELTLFQSLADQAALAVAIGQLLDQQRRMAMLEERERLAREIHDTVAQTLSGLVLQLESVRTLHGAALPTEPLAMLDDARTQAKKALEDTRRAVKDLVPRALERSSAAQAIAEETRYLEARTGLQTRFVTSGQEQPLLPDQQTALLRITQESFSNVEKHANAQRVRVGLSFGKETVTLIVEDDGAGFDVAERAAPQPDGGYGLFGMQERARILGGSLEIDSISGWGTRVRAELPYRPASPLPSARPATDPHQVPTPQDFVAPESDAIRVLVADDHAVTRQGIRLLLEASREARVVGEAVNGDEAARLTAELQPDVVLMDLQMPGVDGVEGLRRIRADHPHVPVVILTSAPTDTAISQALAAGARGFLLKDTEPRDLLTALRAAVRGEAILAPAVAAGLPSLASRAESAAMLNEREREILAMLVEGARNRDIANRLFISPSTVEYHLSNLFSKLGVTNRTEAARVALQQRLVGPK